MTTETTDTTETATILDTLFAELEQAWNAADGARFGAVFSGDADFVDIRGDHHHGAAAIAGGHQAILDSIYRGSTVRYSVASSDVLRPGCVLGIVEATLDAPTGPLQGVHRSTITAVALEDGAGWRVRAFHNTLAAG